MYLSRLILNLRSAAVRKDLCNAQDLHRTIMSGFPQIEGGPARSELGVLFRLEATRLGLTEILVQSNDTPDWGRLPSDYQAAPAAVRDMSSLVKTLSSGARFRFRLYANPTRQIARFDAEGRIRNSARVALRDEAARQEWLTRKAEQSGFRVIESQISEPATAKLIGHVRGESPRTVEAVRYDGLLEIVDTALFERGLSKGIGPGKSYGLGLLSVARASAGAQ